MKIRTKFKTELIAGLTTFLSTVYIVIVNPEILSQAGIPFAAVVTATVLTAALSSIFMGLYADIPIVLAPGMGINAFCDRAAQLADAYGPGFAITAKVRNAIVAHQPTY